MASVLKVDKLDPQSGTALEIGTSGDTVTVPCEVTFAVSGTMNASSITVGTLAVARGGTGTTSYSPGVTMLDQWACSANQDFSADTATLITGSWFDYGTTDSGGNIGSAMTESSGIFTFPSTGVYAIDWVIQIQGAAGTNDAVIVYMYVTTNDSTYTDVNDPGGFFGDAGDRFPFTGHFALDVTDTSNVKIKFNAYSETVGAQIAGDGNRMRTGVTFTRLGDT